MPELSHCIAYTPPPPALKESPNGAWVAVEHPSKALPELQFEECKEVVDMEPHVLMSQPEDVWRVMALLDCWFTPSIISISPPRGQSGPNIPIKEQGVSIF